MNCFLFQMLDSEGEFLTWDEKRFESLEQAKEFAETIVGNTCRFDGKVIKRILVYELKSVVTRAPNEEVLTSTV